MKPKFLWMSWLMILGLIASSLWFAAPANAAPQTVNTLPGKPAQSDVPSGGEYLIALPVTPPDPAQFHQPLNHAAAREFAYGITNRQAAPIVSILKQMQDEGSLSSFEVRADLHGIAVHGLAAEKFSQLAYLPGIAAVLPLGEEQNACAVASAQALIQQVEGISHTVTLDPSAISLAEAEVQTTNPSIEVFYYEDGWGSVSGQTNANTTVRLRIIRGGAVMATESTTSNSDGYYNFYPTWVGCQDDNYNWLIHPGDLIEVTAAGRTYITVVANLLAWMDPLTNQVSGKTDPGRSIAVTVNQMENTQCQSSQFNLTVTPSINGDFTANFGSLIDFKRDAYAIVYSRDANGNSTVQYTSAYSLNVDSAWGAIYGYLKPYTPFILTLLRGSTPISTYDGTTAMDGYFYGWFSEETQPGDVVTVSGGEVTVQYTVAPLTGISLNTALDQVSGITAPNRRIVIYFNKEGRYNDMPTSCSYGSYCTIQNSNMGGGFSASASGFDLVRGDQISLAIYDSEGNKQYHALRVPLISANLTGQRLEGVWQNQPDSYLTVTHKDSGGSVRNIYTGIYVNWHDFYFSTGLSANIHPGDRFEVSDGTRTETMIVPATLPTARLNSSSGHLTGNAPAGSNQILAQLWDYLSGLDGYVDYCRELNPASPGAFDLSFSGAQVNGRDYADIYIRGTDGHYTSLYRRAFYVYHWIGYTDVGGYTESSNVNVNVILRRGTTMLDSLSLNSDQSGYWYALFNTSTSPGDRIEVTTGDGNTVYLDVPQMTMNHDLPANQIYGKSPANRPVQVQLRRHTKNGYYSQNQIVNADGGGNYSAYFNGMYWSRDCSRVALNHRCSASGLRYYTQAGHGLFLWGGYPPSAPADSFENDDALANASPYTVPQTHTFHTDSDADWVSITVPPADVNTITYMLRSVNMGWTVDTRIDLYRSDGTPITWGYGWDGFGWVPDAAGTYYVKVTPYNSNAAAFCDSYYELLIEPVRSRIFLPNINQR